MMDSSLTSCRISLALVGYSSTYRGQEQSWQGEEVFVICRSGRYADGRCCCIKVCWTTDAARGEFIEDSESTGYSWLCGPSAATPTLNRTGGGDSGRRCRQLMAL